MNPLKAIHAALVVGGLALSSVLDAQSGSNNLWMGGFASFANPPFGGVDLQFNSGALVLSYRSRVIEYYRTNANSTNAAGVLLFSTNGSFIANAVGDTIENGAGLAPSWYSEQYPDGLSIPQGAIILPIPLNSNVYYLFHVTIDDWVTTVSEHLYYSVIDMSLDGGLGAVAAKNQVLLDDTLNSGKLSAVRHANGRDWWVFCHKANTNTFYRFLCTPSGIELDGLQSIGMIRPPDAGQVCFSPNGDKFAYYWGDHGMEVYYFDRCTGIFSDPVYVDVDGLSFGLGTAFSPNGRFVYVTTLFDVYQYDTETPDIASTEVHIAHWDSTYSPMPPFAALFDIMQLAPDGKIYISTGNGTDVLHVIHNPDEPGLACNMQQHGIQLERYFSNSLPNHPNYHLGPVDGSVCDSLGITVGMSVQELAASVNIFPNPSLGQSSLRYSAQAKAGVLEIRDLAGRLVVRVRLPQWSTIHTVDLANEAPGLYNVSLSWGDLRTNTRLILTKP